MSLDATIARIQEIESMAGGAPAAASNPTQNQVFAGHFSDQLQNAQEGMGANQIINQKSFGSNVSAKMVSLAQAELARGVRETPDGSNNSTDIARYRTATTGAAAGEPWCAYFVSYIAKEAGAPIGYHGEGMGYVPNIIDWARRTGRFVPPGGQVRPGDLILFSQHIGIVERVNGDGSLTTIEGNHSNRVDRVQRSRSEAVGFARLG